MRSAAARSRGCGVLDMIVNAGNANLDVTGFAMTPAI